VYITDGAVRFIHKREATTRLLI